MSNNLKNFYEIIPANQIEDDGSAIRQVIFFVNDATQYTFDVNKFINFHNLKKILSHAARLPKNTFRIFHENDNVDFTGYEDETLNDFFPNDSKVIFKLYIDLIKMSTEENFDLKLQNTICEIHPTKFKTFYCENCQKSICYNCLQSGHMNHLWKEKIDLLAPAEVLIREIFRNKEDYKINSDYDKTSELFAFKIKMKNEIFDYLRNMINVIENKINDVIDNFNYNVKKCEENVNTNIELLQTYSQEAYILLKNDINTKGIVNDDEIYKILDKKLHEISESKKILSGFNQKYIEINTNYTTIKNYSEKIFKDIFNILQTYTENKFYDELNYLIKNQVVQIITKEQVINRMFNDVDVDRRSLSKENNLSIYRNSLFKNNLNKNNNNIINPFEQMPMINSEPQKKNSNSSNNQFNSANDKIRNVNVFNNSNNNNKYSLLQNSQSQNNSNLSFKSNNKQDFFNNNNRNYGNSQPPFSDLVNNPNTINNISYSQNDVDNSNFNKGNNNFIDKLHGEIQRKSGIIYNSIMFPKENQNIIIESDGNIINPITINFSNTINTEIFAFQTNLCYCNYKDTLYLAGGRNKGKLSTKFLYFNPSNSNRIVYNYSDSNFSHLNGSMIGFKDFIYLIGGEKNNKCERFNLETKNWEILPDLLRETESPILFVYNNYLYAFFGINSDGKIINTIIRLNLNNTKGKWDNVLYNNIDNIDLNIYGCGLILTSDKDGDSLYFIGGKTESEIKKWIVIFNFNGFSFKMLEEAEIDTIVYFKENLFHKMINDKDLGDNEFFVNFSHKEELMTMNIQNAVTME
jgi:hypothetical protein